MLKGEQMNLSKNTLDNLAQMIKNSITNTEGDIQQYLNSLSDEEHTECLRTLNLYLFMIDECNRKYLESRKDK